MLNEDRFNSDYWWKVNAFITGKLRDRITGRARYQKSRIIEVKSGLDIETKKILSIQEETIQRGLPIV